MLPVRLAIILLATILLALGAAPSALAQRQRRVFTNEDVAAAGPAPQAATTPAETAPAPAAQNPGGRAPRSAGCDDSGRNGGGSRRESRGRRIRRPGDARCRRTARWRSAPRRNGPGAVSPGDPATLPHGIRRKTRTGSRPIPPGTLANYDGVDHAVDDAESGVHQRIGKRGQSGRSDGKPRYSGKSSSAGYSSITGAREQGTVDSGHRKPAFILSLITCHSSLLWL